jgi:hypothetical protein
LNVALIDAPPPPCPPVPAAAVEEPPPPPTAVAEKPHTPSGTVVATAPAVVRLKLAGFGAGSARTPLFAEMTEPRPAKMATFRSWRACCAIALACDFRRADAVPATCAGFDIEPLSPRGIQPPAKSFELILTDYAYATFGGIRSWIPTRPERVDTQQTTYLATSSLKALRLHSTNYLPLENSAKHSSNPVAKSTKSDSIYQVLLNIISILTIYNKILISYFSLKSDR